MEGQMDSGMHLGLQQIEIIYCNSELKYDTSGVLLGKLGKVTSNWSSLLLFFLVKKITKRSISSAA